MRTRNARELNGYIVVYDPSNCRAMKNSNWRGYVYEHIKVAGEFLGRPLRKTEVVHHLDGNRSNNRTENLLVLLRSEHTKLHIWLKSAAGKKLSVKNRVNSENTNTSCVVCGKTLQKKQTRTCSLLCDNEYKAKNSKKPSKAELVSSIKSGMSFCALGRKYGVSDNGVRKWARSYGLLT